MPLFRLSVVSIRTLTSSVRKDGFNEYTVASLQLDSMKTARLEATLAFAATGTAVEVTDVVAGINTENSERRMYGRLRYWMSGPAHLG